MTISEPQPFMGITTFGRQLHTRAIEDADVAIVGIPFDSGTSYRSGTRFGPRKIREASMLLWGHNVPLAVSPFKMLKVIDYGDVDIIPVDIKKTYHNIESEVSAILKQNASVIALGGDHSTTLPLLRAHKEKQGPLAVVHFDAHPDTWDREFGDEPFSHGTGFRRAIEEGLIDTSAYIQIGIRGPTSGANDLREARALGARVITIDQALALGVDAVLREVHDKTKGKKVYVSFDIDCVDPAFAPGTGTPEVGGFTSYQALQMVRGLRSLDLLGFDLVEVSPPYDHSEITSILASNLVFEFLSLLALKKNEP